MEGLESEPDLEDIPSIEAGEVRLELSLDRVFKLIPCLT